MMIIFTALKDVCQVTDMKSVIERFEFQDTAFRMLRQIKDELQTTLDHKLRPERDQRRAELETLDTHIQRLKNELNEKRVEADRELGVLRERERSIDEQLARLDTVETQITEGLHSLLMKLRRVHCDDEDAAKAEEHRISLLEAIPRIDECVYLSQ